MQSRLKTTNYHENQPRQCYQEHSRACFKISWLMYQRLSRFRNDHFRIGLFRTGLFRNSLFRNSLFRNGLFRSGLFRSGLFRSDHFLPASLLVIFRI